MNYNYDYDEEEDLDEEVERLMKQKRQVQNKRSRQSGGSMKAWIPMFDWANGDEINPWDWLWDDEDSTPKNTVRRNISIRKKQTMFDVRGIPTPECPACGSWLLKVCLHLDEEYNIAGYLLDAECAMCGTLLTIATPIDHPDYEEML